MLNWFRKNPPAMIGAVITLAIWFIIITLAIFGPWAFAFWIPLIIGAIVWALNTYG